jgi:hypothetical protein
MTDYQKTVLSPRMAQLLRFFATHNVGQRDMEKMNQLTLGALAQRGFLHGRSVTREGLNVLELHSRNEPVARKIAGALTDRVREALGLAYHKARRAA